MLANKAKRTTVTGHLPCRCVACVCWSGWWPRELVAQLIHLAGVAGLFVGDGELPSDLAVRAGGRPTPAAHRADVERWRRSFPRIRHFNWQGDDSDDTPTRRAKHFGRGSAELGIRTCEPKGRVAILISELDTLIPPAGADPAGITTSVVCLPRNVSLSAPPGPSSRRSGG